jgi:3-oxoacyl-[acyl-carrier protein] reductase
MTSDKPLAGKVALITGSSKGIGAATAIHLASLGANVVINYASSSAPAEKLVASLGSENAIAIEADISTLSGIQSLVDETVAKWGKIDIVVANAGVMKLAELEHLTEEAYDKMFNTNVKGPLFLVQVRIHK